MSFDPLDLVNKKTHCFRLVLIRMFGFSVGAIIDRPQTTAKQKRAIHESPLRTHLNFGRDIVFSADLCYNEVSEKPPSEREVARVA